MSERKLVTIQTVTDIQPIANADNIEAARVMGWTVVVKKGEFQVGDPCVFFEIDSVLPDGPEWSEFMRPRGFRVKTVRLRGVLSQGLALPHSIVFPYAPVGSDVTAVLGVTKYEPPTPLGAEIAGPFPVRVPKTDEIRLQSCLGVLDELRGLDFYVTTKCDGMSATYVRTEEGLTCASRNWSLSPGSGHIWKIAEDLKLAERLPYDMAIQGEVCGPGIQKNRLNLTTVQLFVFNVYDVRAGRYMNYEDMMEFCESNGLRTVPVEFFGGWTFEHSLEDWLERAKGLYPGTKNRKEGIVVRPMKETRSATLGGRLSFKVINNDYLLRDED